MPGPASGPAGEGSPAGGAGRGAFIVFEGLDRCGKSTQSAKLVDALKAQGLDVQRWNFPDRQHTLTGAAINAYLQRKADVPDAAIHLMFSANRWEKRDALLGALRAGTTLVVDRYACSGAAYSAAKQVQGMDLAWCRAPDEGLPAPDATVFLRLDQTAAASRGGYGAERYEQQEFQARVGEQFQRLEDSSWVVLEADQAVDDLHQQVLAAVLPVVQQCAAGQRPLRRLWDLQPLAPPGSQQQQQQQQQCSN